MSKGKKTFDPRTDVVYYPHRSIHVGKLIFDDSDPKIRPNFSRSCKIDLTGSVDIGNFSWIGHGAKILTHRHFHVGEVPMRIQERERGVQWLDKSIGVDVWLYSCVILMDVTMIPDGVIVGAYSVLTKNPEVPYGIYAGNPAVLIGKR